MTGLLVFVLRTIPFWDQAFPPLACVLDIINTHFKNPAVEMCGEIEKMNILVAAVMKTTTVYLSDRPDTRPVHTDILYLMSPEQLPTGVHSITRKVLIVSPTMTGASSIFNRTRLTNTIFLHQGNAYSWSPYDPSECHAHEHLTSVGTCHSEGFINHSAVFNQKLPVNFEGCPLQVHRASCLPPSLVGFTDGIDPPEDEVLEMIVESFNFSLVDHFLNDSLNFYHFWPESQLADAGKLLYTQEVDLSFHCCLTMPRNFSMYEILPSFQEEFMVWFVPTPLPAPLISGLYSGFTVIIWSLVISSYIIFTSVYYLASNFYNEPRSFFDCLLLALAYLTGDIVKGSKQVFPRILEMLFLFYVLHIVAFYESGLLWNLFQIPMNAPIESANQALDEGLDIYMRHYADIAFNQSNHEFWNRVLAPGGHKSVLYMNAECIVQKKCIFLGLRGIDTAGFRFQDPLMPFKESINILPEAVNKLKSFVNISPGNPFFHLFSEKFMQIIESGIPEFCLKTTIRALGPEKNEEIQPKRRLKIVNLQSAFYLLIMMLILSFLVFCWEILIWRFYYLKKVRRTMFRTKDRFSEHLWGKSIALIPGATLLKIKSSLVFSVLLIIIFRDGVIITAPPMSSRGRKSSLSIFIVKFFPVFSLKVLVISGMITFTNA